MHGQECRGLILNSMPGPLRLATETNKAALEVCDIPILFEIASDQRSLELAIA